MGMNSAAQPSILVDDSDAYYYPLLAYARVGDFSFSFSFSFHFSVSAPWSAVYRPSALMSLIVILSAYITVLPRHRALALIHILSCKSLNA